MYNKRTTQQKRRSHTDDFEKLTGRKPITVREIFEHMNDQLIGSRTSTDE